MRNSLCRALVFGLGTLVFTAGLRGQTSPEAGAPVIESPVIKSPKITAPEVAPPEATPPPTAAPQAVPPPLESLPPLPGRERRLVTPEDVVALGALVSDLPAYRDNPYLRDAAAARIQRITESLVGAPTDVFVFVRRVTRREVMVEVYQVGRARYALLHDVPPEFGNLGTWRYEPPMKLQNFHRFTSPVGLRIGTEIPLELAARLRHGDKLRVRGRIVATQAITQRSAFNPSASLIVGDWKVVEVMPETNY